MASVHQRDVLPLEVRDLGVQLGERRILSGVSFRLDAGKRTVILGPNGAGKTSLLRALHGLIPSTGSITWAGGERQRGAEAMMFQHPVMLRRGALANVEYALAVNGVEGAERRHRARAALEEAGLSELALQPARSLSGGKRQRLALARAWALRPRILYLDEPTASLDPGASATVEREIGRIHDAGTRIVMTTHRLGLARRVADEILFLDDGRLVEQTPADRFFEAPGSEQARHYLDGELP